MAQVIPLTPRDRALSQAEEFTAFYELYPRKKSKGAARLAFARARKLVTFEELMAGVEDYIKWLTAEGTEMRYVKHPSTWLNQECWDDDNTPSTETLGGGGGWGDLL